MSEFGKPKICMNECGGMVYAHSSVGHPSPDKWIPLQFKEGRKTDMIHDCQNKPQNGQLLTTTVTETTTMNQSPINLGLIQEIAAALSEYIAIKESGK